MTWTSTAPAVMDYLDTLWSAASDGFDVRNGTVVSAEENLEGVVVGYASPPGVSVANAVLDPEDYHPDDHEVYTITSAVKVATGADDYLPARRRAFAILGICANAIGVDRRLGGLVAMSRISGWSLLEPPEGVTTVTIAFGVDVDAYTS